MEKVTTIYAPEEAKGGYSVVLYKKKKVHKNDIYKIYNDGFSGNEFRSPDAMPLFGKHYWCSSDRTWNNSSNKKLSVKEFKNAIKTGLDFLDSQGESMLQEFDEIIVKKGGNAEKVAKQLKIKVIGTEHLESPDVWILKDSKAELFKCDKDYLGIIDMPYSVFGSLGTS